MRNFVNKGRSIVVTAVTAVTSSDLVIVGEYTGFAQTSAAAGETYVLNVEGRYETNVDAEADAPQGAPIYFDAERGVLTTASNDGAAPSPVEFRKVAKLARAGVSSGGVIEKAHVDLL